MEFEKVDLFCPKCGKYSVYKDPTDYECENYTERHACQSCLHTCFLGEVNHDPKVFNPKPVQNGDDSLFPKDNVKNWAKKRLKQIEEFKFLSGTQWEKMEGTFSIKVTEPFKCPTYEGDMKDLEIKAGDGKTIGECKVTIDKLTNLH